MVTCTPDCEVRFSDDTVVSFSGVRGMTELNGRGPLEIKYLGEGFARDLCC